MHRKNISSNRLWQKEGKEGVDSTKALYFVMEYLKGFVFGDGCFL